jgi:uncharacterized protein YpuA (DUF1002 family)
MLISECRDTHIKEIAEVFAIHINEVAKKLSHELSKYGTSELSYFKDIFSWKPSEKATVVGSIDRRAFRVIMFEASQESEITAISAHFSLNIKEMNISEEQAAFWNADNRFTKIYHQHDDVLIVLDSFLPSENGYNIIQSVVKIWSGSIYELKKLKLACERRGIF